MRILIIGGVAAGTKAAAKLKREDRFADIKILTKGKDISYAGCGLPYYVSFVIPHREDLIVNTPESFSSLTGVEVSTGTEVVDVDFSAHKVIAIKEGRRFEESYDKLIIATGASPFVPDIPGVDIDGVFSVRTPGDAIAMRDWVKKGDKRKAVVVGAGFIGLEMAENLSSLGLDVTVLDLADQILPNLFDPEMAFWAERQLKARGISIFTNTSVSAINGDGVVTGVETSNGLFDADMVVLAIGIRPNTEFLASSGLEMFKGTIVVDDKMRTNIEDVYASGDCALVKNRVTGKNQWSAMGSTANISARILAKSIMGHDVSYSGVLGTGVIKLTEGLNAGRTGLTEAAARESGFDPISVVAVTDDKAHYYPDSAFFVTKLIADKKSHRILGLQVLGAGEVDKMIDIAVVAISSGLRLSDIDDMDFAYAPPFSTAIHPFVQCAYILENKLLGEFETMTPYEFLKTHGEGYQMINALSPYAFNDFENTFPNIAKDDKILLVCARGKRAYFLQNRLKALGYTNTRVLEGGMTVNMLNA